MDAIFKALNDTARRTLLDSLRVKDGQTLTELEEQLDMTRFGVMKHLKVLEDAHLVVTRKKGRFKHHYLNAVPLQEVIDRWIDPFLAKPAARAIIDLKSQLEGMTDMQKPDLVLSTFINCSHDDLWEALTKGDLIAKYHFATPHVKGDLTDGGGIVLQRADGSPMLTQKVLNITPKSEIDLTFELAGGAPMQRCRFLVEQTGAAMKLTVEHFDMPGDQTHTTEGWTRWLSGIKSYMENGSIRAFALDMH